MTQLAYDRLAATAVSSDPFRHIIVPEFVPPEALARVVADLPPLERRGSFPIGSLRFGPAAAQLMEELEGPRFRRAIADTFSLDLDDAPTMLTLRGASTERDGLIHRDSDAKRVTVLLYLNPASAAWTRHEGCLRLLRRPDDLDDFAVEVPPANGTLLVFPNAANAWHGHKTFIGRRYVAQLNYMTTDAAARSELRRHRFSALVKRLTQAA
ncbi:MAG TPA: 2OG-Fe(II) oxygenase [Acetobacteraceae bacterium]|jgi:SM-20-related protein|nr:2OG-Fe(II) oxygenase [Acetobacteraceae bacterium]